MRRSVLRYWIVGLLVALAGAAILAYFLLEWMRAGFIDPTADPGRIVLGKAVYENNCAACHGVTLQGQPNWRERMANGRLPAPPHDQTGHTWHHPDHLLINMVKNGLVPGRTAPPGYESDMPAYAGVLTDEEIIAVIAYIKGTWPTEVLQSQKQITVKTRP